MPAIFINTTGTMGKIIETASNNLTGNLTLTLFLLLIVVIVIALIFRLPFDLLSVFLVPLILIFMAYQGQSFLAIGGVFLIYLAILVAKNWFIK